MTQDEYNQKKKLIEDHIKSLQNDLQSLKKEYAESSPFQQYVGKKVRCYDTYYWGEHKGERVYKGDAYLSGIEISYIGFRLKFNKIKKDGSMSNVSAGLYDIDYVEPIED